MWALWVASNTASDKDSVTTVIWLRETSYGYICLQLIDCEATTGLQAMAAEKGHQPRARALAVAKCSIHPVYCDSVPYEFPNQIK